MSHILGYRDGRVVAAAYRIDIDTTADIRQSIELSAAAKSPPTGHEQSNPKTGFKRVIWAENAEVKNQLVDELSNDGIDYKVTDLSATLSEVKDAKIKQIKNDAKDVLEQTDWYVIRKHETGESVPQTVLDHRSNVRSLSDDYEADVDALDSIDGVEAYEYSFPDPPK